MCLVKIVKGITFVFLCMSGIIKQKLGFDEVQRNGGQKTGACRGMSLIS